MTMTMNPSEESIVANQGFEAIEVQAKERTMKMMKKMVQSEESIVVIQESEAIENQVKVRMKRTMKRQQQILALLDYPLWSQLKRAT